MGRAVGAVVAALDDRGTQLHPTDEAPGEDPVPPLLWGCQGLPMDTQGTDTIRILSSFNGNNYFCFVPSWVDNHLLNSSG